jgi:hypothetical protein
MRTLFPYTTLFRSELAKNYIFFRLMVGYAEQIEQQNHEEADDDPEKDILCPGIHPDLLVDGTFTRSEKSKALVMLPHAHSY